MTQNNTERAELIELVDALRMVSGRCSPESQLVVDKALQTFTGVKTDDK